MNRARRPRVLTRAAGLAIAALSFAGSACSSGAGEADGGPPGADSGGTAPAGEDGGGGGGSGDGRAGPAAPADGGSADRGPGGGGGVAEGGQTAGGDGSAQAEEGGGSDAVAGGGAPAPSDPKAALGHCQAPAGASWDDALAAYAKWKGDLVTSDGAAGFRRVRRPNSAGAIDTSNSEGTAYGMILAVAMDDEPLFDDLWRYEQRFLDASGLMNWEINPQGTGPTGEGTGAATDADEDMAYALLWADHRWGGAGALSDSYRNLALHQIDLLWQHEVDHTRNEALAPGDQFSDGAAVLNISYFAPAYYRLFGAASGKSADWNKVVESSYAILNATLDAANKNVDNGLVPAWSTPAGVPQSPNGSLPTNHQLDSCRVPFRFGQDDCWYGEARAKTYLAKISAFYQQVGAGHIVNGYDLDGTPDPTNPTVNQSAAFVGPAGVGAMSDPAFAVLRDQAYAGVATLNELDGSTYYTESWTALSLVMMAGGFWNPSP